MSPLPRVSALAIATTLAVIASPAWAQQAEEIVVTAQAENATEVVNGGDAGVLGNKPAEDLPFSIRSFDESLILNQQPLTLGDVLENDPTIRATYAFGNAAELFVIRGFTLAGDDLGLNGLYGIAPRQIVAPELYESVQVLNGASAFLNGAAPGGSGLGGSVNLKLKRAGSGPLTRATVGYTSDAHFGGSFDVSRRFGTNGEWGLRVNGAYRDGEVSVDREDRRTQVIGGALDYDGGNFRAALDLAYQNVRVDHLRPKVTIGGLGAIPAVPEADANYAQDFTFTELRDVFGTLNLEWDVADNALLYARAGANDSAEEGIYGGITVTDAVTGAATGSASYIPYEANNEALEAGIRVNLGETVTHEFNFGANVNWQTFRTAYDFRQGYATNLYDTPQVAFPPANPASWNPGGDIDDPFPIGKSRQWSAFASDTVGLWDERILVTGGMRLQTIRTEGFSYDDGSRSTFYEENAVTPVVGVVFKPLPYVSLYANRIEALQPGPVASTDPIDNLVNPGEPLAPRKSTQYEAGAKLALGSLLYAGLAVYQIERPGEGVIVEDDGGRRFGYLGEQRNRGIEFTVNGEPVEGVRIIAGLATIDAELDSGAEVAGVPGFTANANLEWDLPFAPGLTLTGRMTHTGKQWTDTANTLRLDDWTVFDLGARYVLAAGETPVTLRLTVDNVANERYWASSFDPFNAALLQGSPRTIKASISADF
tara:strand:+ start:4817 stop:6949 length:2133 start_codon:yes stop_codon:yes gene_type:complete